MNLNRRPFVLYNGSAVVIELYGFGKMASDWSDDWSKMSGDWSNDWSFMNGRYFVN